MPLHVRFTFWYISLPFPASRNKKRVLGHPKKPPQFSTQFPPPQKKQNFFVAPKKRFCIVFKNFKFIQQFQIHSTISNPFHEFQTNFIYPKKQIFPPPNKMSRENKKTNSFHQKPKAPLRIEKIPQKTKKTHVLDSSHPQNLFSNSLQKNLSKWMKKKDKKKFRKSIVVFFFHQMHQFS